MSNKIISIIIATYNAAYTIERCLCSIISQKTDDIELIIIDGASKDQTIAIIEQYKDSIDVFFSEPDQGIYDAWNKGIKASNGEWIMFVGADDQLISGALSSYLSFLSDCSKENADIVTAKAVVIDDKGKEIEFSILFTFENKGSKYVICYEEGKEDTLIPFKYEYINWSFSSVNDNIINKDHTDLNSDLISGYQIYIDNLTNKIKIQATEEKYLGVCYVTFKYTKEEGNIKIYMSEKNILCIEDDGIGIAKEDLPRIFEKGYTGYNGREQKNASGIGLFLCKRILSNL